MNWPLAISPFTALDRLKIGAWLLRNRQLTAGPEVRAYEERWEQYTGAKHAIMVASGSVANELIALKRKDELIKSGFWTGENRVIFPACTWISSVSPWIREGFKPVWCDVSTNLCASADGIRALLEDDNDFCTVFYTTLLGQATDLYSLRSSCFDHGAALILDNCESPFGATSQASWHPIQHFSRMATSSTSFYFSHPATTGTEGGMIFCKSDDDAEWYRMMRNHGMTRGMPDKYHNPDVREAFDFNLLGSNYRSTDLQAYMGSLTFERSLAFVKKRIELATVFYQALDKERYVDVTQGGRDNPLMALPILKNPTGRTGSEHVSVLLDRLGIQHRPIVGGNLLRHTAFKGYGHAGLYPRAQWLHNEGVYVGLHAALNESMVLQLAEELNK